MIVVPTIRVAPNRSELAQQAAQRVAAAADEAVAATGRFVLALSGGKTPQELFRLLASDFATKIPWDKTHVLFADERCVPADHPDSNFGAACRLLLDHVNIAYTQVHRMAGEKDPRAAAAEYDALLADGYPNGPDLLLLGIGEDGHTASLFAGSAALAERERCCVANYVDRLAAWRLTMTAPYMNRAFEVLVLAAGKEKAGIIQDALEGEPGRLPIQLIGPASGRFVWLLDAESAGMNEDEASSD